MAEDENVGDKSIPDKYIPKNKVSRTKKLKTRHQFLQNRIGSLPICESCRGSRTMEQKV